MKISAFIERLEQLRAIAGDVEVGVTLTEEDNDPTFESATAQLSNVTPLPDEMLVVPPVKRWKCPDEGNTEQIVTVY